MLIQYNIDVIDNKYISQYFELMAIQKSVFEIDTFGIIDFKIISKAINYCNKQPNFRNSVVLEFLVDQIKALREK